MLFSASAPSRSSGPDRPYPRKEHTPTSARVVLSDGVLQVATTPSGTSGNVSVSPIELDWSSHDTLPDETVGYGSIL